MQPPQTRKHPTNKPASNGRGPSKLPERNPFKEMYKEPDGIAGHTRVQSMNEALSIWPLHGRTIATKHVRRSFRDRILVSCPYVSNLDGTIYSVDLVLREAQHAPTHRDLVSQRERMLFSDANTSHMSVAARGEGFDHIRIALGSACDPEMVTRDRSVSKLECASMVPTDGPDADTKWDAASGIVRPAEYGEVRHINAPFCWMVVFTAVVCDRCQ